MVVALRKGAKIGVDCNTWAHSHCCSRPYHCRHYHAIAVAAAAAGIKTPPSNLSSLHSCNNVLLEVPGMQEHIVAPRRRVWAVSGTVVRGRKGVFTPPGQQGPFQLCSVFFLLLYSCST